MTTPLYAADSMGKAFGGKVVLRAASVRARPGELTVLFGRNGSGKSTLLKVGVGVLAADFGVVHFDGAVHVRPRLHRLAARGLFYLPDRNQLLSPRRPLEAHLDALRWRFGAPHLPDVLAELGLLGLEDRRPHEMSGGERRRAEIALAWARRPRCLLADEPFSGIDPGDAERVGAILTRLARDGCAVVVTGHDVPLLMRIADDVVWMTAGTTHGLGSAEAAARHDQFRREYLGPGRTM